MIRVVTEPASILHRRADEVQYPLTGKSRVHLNKLETALRLLPGAAGIAAPQLGIPKRLIAVRLDGGDDQVIIMAFINPELTPDEEGEKSTEPESCLSLPGVRVPVERWNGVTVRASNLENELYLYGWEARIVQHEVDHLDGKLITDYAVE